MSVPTGLSARVLSFGDPAQGIQSRRTQLLQLTKEVGTAAEVSGWGCWGRGNSAVNKTNARN